MFLSKRNNNMKSFLDFIGEPKRTLNGIPLPPLGTYLNSNINQLDFKMETLLLMEMAEQKEYLTKEEDYLPVTIKKFQEVLREEQFQIDSELETIMETYFYNLEYKYVSKKSDLEKINDLWLKKQRNTQALRTLAKILDNSAK